MKNLPQCKISNYSRQSCLHGIDKDYDLRSKISENYPISYYYIRKQDAISFYYKKNDLISYYMHSILSTNSWPIPLYNYLKNDYEIILSSFPYNFMNHNEICVVKAPNRQIYVIRNYGFMLSNASKNTLLYDLSNNKNYLFHSMPIANTFLLVVMRYNEEMIIRIIDLIKEKMYVKKYPIKKIIDKLLIMLEKSKHYMAIKSIITPYISSRSQLEFRMESTNSIDNSTGNLVFYNRCVVNISIIFNDNKANNKITLVNLLSIIAFYEKRKLTVSLQLNSEISVNADSINYCVNFGTSTVLVSSTYEIGDDYDLAQSHLYSVTAVAGDYIIISEPNELWTNITLYYKNKTSSTSSDTRFIINSYSDFLYIVFHKQRLLFTYRDRLDKLSKTDLYYVEQSNSYIGIIDTKVIRELFIDSIHERNYTSMIGIDITDVMEYVVLRDKLEQMVRRYVRCDYFQSFHYAYYIHYDAEELYLLIYFQCLERIEVNEYREGKYTIYLLRGKINCLFSSHNTLRLVWKFETDVPLSNMPKILTKISGDESKILKPFSIKWNTGVALLNLKVFEMYNKEKAYYDYEYNRSSIRLDPKGTHVMCNLHLVRRITKTL